ncbi:hypothetical protein SEPCBS57363_003797 [Sporothrix epigloea]|uniref:Thioredoxin-like protein AAED1 n=1 Tax=Sporothrix epigloea TaxID=1892477 RepID=A0ABP0DNG1_9PEZI
MDVANNTRPAAVAAPVDNDKINPTDFEGSVRTDNGLPSKELIRRIADLPVLDRQGKMHSFNSLYMDFTGRTLVIFVRHFFCGNCQEYLRILSKAIPLELLAKADTPTRIMVVGCGDPALIDFYVEASSCAYPVYADPTRRLYDELGMVSTLAMGAPPRYMEHTNMWASSFRSIIDGLKQVSSGLWRKSGDKRQVGGEFLFENPGNGDDISVSWCHRMKTTRDHTETRDMQNLLDLDKAMTKADASKATEAGASDVSAAA